MAATFSRRLLLLCWDAAEARRIRPLLERGEMPNLAGLLAQGVSGDLNGLLPPVAPLVRTSLLTGLYADRHGVLGASEICPQTGIVRPVTGLSRKSRTLANMIHLQGGRAHVVNTPLSYPAERVRGLFVSDAITATIAGQKTTRELLPESYWLDPDLSARFFPDPTRLTDLRLHPSEIDPSLLTLFVPRAAEIDQDQDMRLSLLADALAETFTVHNYATLAVTMEPWNLTVVSYPALESLHRLFRFHGEEDPIYQDVIDSGYRLHDLLLARLLELVGEETMVLLVSEGAPGLFVLRAPETNQGSVLRGVRITDIVPTALTLLGLPIGNDMPGRVLTEAFANPPAVGRIASWEFVPGEDARRQKADTPLSLDASTLFHECFLRRGWTAPGENDPESVDLAGKWNLTRHCFGVGRYDQALPIAIDLFARLPQRDDIASLLGECFLHFGMTPEVRELLTKRMEERPESLGFFLLGQAAVAEKAYGEARRSFAEAEREEYGVSAPILIRLGQAYFRLLHFGDATRVLEKATEQAPQEAIGWVGRAGCAILRHDLPTALASAREAIRLDETIPLAHIVLGRTFLAQGRTAEAIASFETALRLDPQFAFAAQNLYHTFRKQPGQEIQAAHYRHLWRDLLVRQEKESDERARMRAQINAHFIAQMRIRWATLSS